MIRLITTYLSLKQSQNGQICCLLHQLGYHHEMNAILGLTTPPQVIKGICLCQLTVSFVRMHLCNLSAEQSHLPPAGGSRASSSLQVASLRH